MLIERFTGRIGKFIPFKAATQAQQEGGTSLGVFVSPGRQQFHLSAAKLWGTVDRSAGTPSLSSPSYNISGVSDDGAGNTVVVVGTDFSDVDYAVGANGRATNTVASPHSVLVTSFDVEVRNTESSLLDTADFSCWAFGDQ